MRAWGRLLRLSLAPTAAADVAAGAVAGAGGWPSRGSEPWRALALVAASLCVYHGGMALNDWADREGDRRSRPDRPIPSGAVPASAALAAGALLLLAGPLLASLASRDSAIALLGVSALALAYDVGPRGARSGPLLLGLCRAGNLSAGLAFGAGAALGAWTLLPALVYGAYVLAVSSLARLEDASAAVVAGSRPSLHLAVAGAILAASPAAALALHPAGLVPAVLAFVLALLGAAGLWRARRSGTWSSAELTRATGLGLRRLLVFTAALALAAGGREGPLVAAAILAGYPVSYLLRGVFPPS